MSSAVIAEALENLSFLLEENDVNKRCREKAQQAIEILNSNAEFMVENALIKLEEIGSDLSSYHRTQVWSIISILESAK
jgi:uncharacterized protein (UPF0147 family)